MPCSRRSRPIPQPSTPTSSGAAAARRPRHLRTHRGRIPLVAAAALVTTLCAGGDDRVGSAAAAAATATTVGFATAAAGVAGAPRARGGRVASFPGRGGGDTARNDRRRDNRDFDRPRRRSRGCTAIVGGAAAASASEGGAAAAAEASPRSWAVPRGVEFGRLDALRLVRVERDETSSSSSRDERGPSPSGRRCRVATGAVGLNFADVFCVLGLYSAANEVRRGGAGVDEAFVPGLEFSGIVLGNEDGEDDPDAAATYRYRAGDRVLGFTRFGAYADEVAVDPVFLKRLPDSWTFAQGAGFIVQALTAWHGLVEIGRLPDLSSSPSSEAGRGRDASPPDPYVVVVHSAGGGVGLWASEIAARRGAVVIGVVGDDTKASAFRDRIVGHLSPHSTTLLRGDERTFGDRLAAATRDVRGRRRRGEGGAGGATGGGEMDDGGAGADLVMESLGGGYLRGSLDCLNDGGALVTYGSTSYVSPGLGKNLPRLVYRYLTRPRVDPGILTSRNLRLAGFNLIFLTERSDRLRRELDSCIACLSGTDERTGRATGDLPLDGVTPPVIGEVFSFDGEAVRALEKLKGGSTIGKVVLDNSNNPLLK